METDNQQTEYLSNIDSAKFFLTSLYSHEYFYDIINDGESIVDVNEIIDEVTSCYSLELAKTEMPIIDTNDFNDDDFSELEASIKEIETTTVHQIINKIENYDDIRLKLLYYKILLPFCKNQTHIGDLNERIKNLQIKINQRAFQKQDAYNVYKNIIYANPDFNIRFRKMIKELNYIYKVNPTGIKKLISYFDELSQEIKGKFDFENYRIADNDKFSIISDNEEKIKIDFSYSEIHVLNNFFHELMVKLTPQEKFPYSKHLIKQSLNDFLIFLKLINSDEINNYSVSQYYFECQENFMNLENIIIKEIVRFDFYDRFLFFHSLIDILDNNSYKDFHLTTIWTDNIKPNKKADEVKDFDINNHKISIPLCDLLNKNKDEALIKSSRINFSRSSSIFLKQLNNMLKYYCDVPIEELFPQKNIDTLQTNDYKTKEIPEKKINSFGFKVHLSFDLDKYYESILLEYGKSSDDSNKIKNAAEIVQILKASDWNKCDAIKIDLNSKDFNFSLILIYNIFNNLNPNTISSSCKFKSKKNNFITAAQLYNAKNEIEKDFKNGISHPFYEDLIIYIKNCTMS